MRRTTKRTDVLKVTFTIVIYSLENGLITPWFQQDSPAVRKNVLTQKK